MRYSFILILFSFAVCAARAEPQPPEGFIAIFNGKDLRGWHGNNPHQTPKGDHKEKTTEQEQAEFQKHWTVEGGELVSDGHGPYATTDKEYGDIELLIDYKTVQLADSGIYLRGTPQIQIWDYTKEGGKWKLGADKGSGGLYNNSSPKGKFPLVRADKAFGEWNHLRIRQIGTRTWVWLNEKLVVDGAIYENYWDKERREPLPRTGPIHLQTHGGEIRWRNIFLREIPSTEANAILRAEDKGLSPIFNGEDLSGWTGAVESHEIVNGVLRSKKGKGGTLYTEEEYGDFVARLEFKLPSGGNNGLAIRYPGNGIPAYAGMTELQILDNSAEKYAGKLDRRQYHGSAYGMVAAATGYLRPVGEWNYQKVTVKGSTIRVELNGTVILDTDLSEIEEFMDNRRHPGKDLKKGHFGFANHNTQVEFRNIGIQKL